MMTREQIEQAIEDNLDSIAFDEEGRARRTSDGQPAGDDELRAALATHERLEKLLRVTP